MTELLPQDEIHVWLMQRPVQVDAALLACTTSDEQARANSMISARRYCEWIAGRALLRQCLACYTNSDGLALAFDKTEAGKPFLDLHTAPAFNLSHGPRWIACAVSQSGDNIGIDIDSEARRNRTDDIAARYFHPHEQSALLHAGDTQQRKHVFFRQWTLKEAYIKACGETINSVRLHELGFGLADDGSVRPLFRLSAAGQSDSWKFSHWHFDSDHHLALACQRSQCDTSNAGMPVYRFWLWDAATQSRRELTDKWPCIL